MTLTDIRQRPVFRRGVCAALLGAAVLATGCASAQAPGGSALQSPPANAQPSPQSSAPPTETAGIRALAARYLAIAVPANHRLEVAVDDFRKSSRDNLAKAAADLRSEAITERHFDRQLARIRFPAAIEAIASALIRANQSRIRLTRREARAASLGELSTFAGRHKAADAAVEIQVKAIRKALGLPPPSAS
jgi:hypothetical protein